jgi:hypothetical protein
MVVQTFPSGVFRHQGRSTMSDPGTMTGKPLIESDRVEGTTVYDPHRKH